MLQNPEPDRKRIQESLRTLDKYSGPIDGDLQSEASVKAIGEWQKGRGTPVVVQIANAQGQINDRVTLINRSRIVHEIESLLLPRGGQTQLDGRGQSVPSTGIGTMRASTQIASNSTGSPACGEVYPRWVSANATDPVFTSAFGALNGSVIIARPPARSAIRSDNGPEWLVTYPLAASRVQFIAHYEIEYRVRYCPAGS